MAYEWDQRDDIAAGSSCPKPDCGAMAVAYRSADDAGRDSKLWKFICPRCGIDFTVPEAELIFQSAPKGWRLAKVETG
jgi:hypothetical protein